MKRSETGGDDVVGFATVSVKVRPAEKEEFKRACVQLGLTPNKATRIMMRQVAGFVELSEKSVGNLETISKQIIGVSRNINQIAKAANITHSPDYIAFREDGAELCKEIRLLQNTLQNVLNTARRRTDGLKALKDTAERS